MPEKKSLRRTIIGLLVDRGTLSFDELVEATGWGKDPVRKRIYELKKDQKVLDNGDMTYTAGAGVKPEDIPESDPEESPPDPKEKDPPAAVVLDARDQFSDVLKRVGIKESIIPTLTQMFVNGDIDDPEWVDNVLLNQARGHVNVAQHRLVRNFWGNIRNLGWKPIEDFDEPAKGKSKPALVSEDVLDPGLGWKPGKDKAGDWIAVPGGPFTREEAENRAEKRQALKAIGQSSSSDDDGDDKEEGKGKPRKQESVSDKMMGLLLPKLIEQMTEGPKKGENEEVKLLREELKTMKENQMEQRLQSMEAQVAAAAARDPMADFEEMQRKRRAMGLDQPIVTDASPAVQLLKSSADKVDRQIDRVGGLMERYFAARMEGPFKPEHTRTAEQREGLAGDLLSLSDERKKSIALRDQTFNLG